MEKPYQLELEEVEVEEEERISKQILKWGFRNAKFLLIPASRLDDLTQREFEHEKLVSKRKFLRRLKSVLTVLGIVIILFIVTLAVFPHWLSPYSFEQATAYLTGSWDLPSPGHPLGKAAFGRDVLARIIFGARTSLTIALPAILISVAGGIVVGVIAAYYRGWIDSVLMRICDVFLAFPGLVLALVFIAIFGRRLEMIILVWGFLGIPFYARLIRGNVLQARELPYIDAARVAGAGDWRIMFKHILPNTIQPVIISFTFDIGTMVLSLAGLAYLGFSDPDMIEWGSDINDARLHLHTSPIAAFAPGFMILICVLGFMLLGDGLRDALDPRLRNI